MFRQHTTSKRTAIPGPVASAPFRNLLEMRIQACTRPVQSDTPEGDPASIWPSIFREICSRRAETGGNSSMWKKQVGWRRLQSLPHLGFIQPTEQEHQKSATYKHGRGRCHVNDW